MLQWTDHEDGTQPRDIGVVQPAVQLGFPHQLHLPVLLHLAQAVHLEGHLQTR